MAKQRGHPGKRFIAIDPQGVETEQVGLRQFCEDNGLDPATVRKVMRGERPSCKGWRFRDAGERAPETDDQADAIVADLTEMMTGGGVMDPRELVAKVMNATMLMSLGMVDGKEPPPGWNAAAVTKACELFCATQGIDLKHAVDQRTDAEKFMDGVAELTRNGSAIWELPDPELNEIERQFMSIDTHAPQFLAKLESVRADQLLPADQLPPGQNAEDPPDPKTVAAASRAWVDRIRRVRHVAERARQPSMPGVSPRERVIQESTHVLRYMLYVNRADISFTRVGQKKSLSVYIMAEHHVRMSMGLYFSRNHAGVGVVPGRVLFPGDEYTDAQGKHKTYDGCGWTGTMFMLPPRHSKTDFLKAVVGLMIGVNPRVQIAYVHDTDGGAGNFHSSVRDMFNPDESQGRRNRRLFPYTLADKDNNSSQMRVKVDNPPRNPNLLSSGIRGSWQGLNLDLLIGDDLVPTKDVDHPTDRERRATIWGGTWLSRLQGQNPHVIYSGYPRHFGDLMWLKYLDAKKAGRTGFREGDPLWVMRAPVGGPSSSVPFKPLWPEMYPAPWLRQQYKRLNNPTTWAANYMCQPMSEEMKIVRRVRLLDIDDPAVKHLLNPKNTENHLSVDPAAKGDGSGDKAGLVVLSVGDLVRQTDFEDGQGYETDRETLAVVRVAREFDATQFELMDEMRDVSQSMPIHRAHVECVTGLGSAIIEALGRFHNVQGINAIKASTNKKQRFKAVAGMVENADPLLPAKVAFFAQRAKDEHGNTIPDSPLEPLPEYDKLISYITNFAVEDGFHSLDAFTQICRELMVSLGVGDGSFSSQVRRDYAASVPASKIRYLERLEKQKRTTSHRGGRRRVGLSAIGV